MKVLYEVTLVVQREYHAVVEAETKADALEAVTARTTGRKDETYNARPIQVMILSKTTSITTALAHQLSQIEGGV